MGNEKTVNIVLTGDIMLGGSLDNIYRSKGFDTLFEPLSPYFSKADIVFGNLEAPLSNKGIPAKTKIVLHQDAQVASALKKAGFRLVSLANNHIMDYGKEALQETLSILDNQGIQHVGAGMNSRQARQPAEFLINGLKIFFLGYVSQTTEESNPLCIAEANKAGVVLLDKDTIRTDIKNAKDNGADIVIICAHWGIDKYHYPLPELIDLAHMIIDSGADIIVGHHSHYLQGIEEYNKGVIIYSLGNFLFGDFKLPNGRIERWLPKNRQTALVIFKIIEKQTSGYELIPLLANTNGKVQILKNQKEKRALRDVQMWSKALKDPDYKKNWQKRVWCEKTSLFFEKCRIKLEM